MKEVEKSGRTFLTVREISGPLVFIKSVTGVGFGELVEVTTPRGEKRTGQVIDVSEEVTIIQVFEGTRGLDTDATAVRFTGETLKLPVSTEILGRVLDGSGNPLDNGPQLTAEDHWDIYGSPINPYARQYPRQMGPNY